MALSNPWWTVGSVGTQQTNGSTQAGPMSGFLQTLSGKMGATAAQTQQSSSPAYFRLFTSTNGQPMTDASGTPKEDEHPPFPNETTNTNKNYKDPRTQAPGWVGGSNLFDDDSHGANVIGQLLNRQEPAPEPGGGGSGDDGDSDGGGHHGGGHHGGHHGGHSSGDWGGYGGWGGWLGRWW